MVLDIQSYLQKQWLHKWGRSDRSSSEPFYFLLQVKLLKKLLASVLQIYPWFFLEDGVNVPYCLQEDAFGTWSGSGLAAN